jgi:sugar-specific transcriptional regulator TrmB
MANIIKQKEKRVLLGLYKLKSASAQNLAKITLINRTTLYPILEKLITKGLVTKIQTEGKIVFRPITPEEFKTWAVRKEEELKKENNELHGWIVSREKRDDTSLVSDIKFYEGMEGVKNLYHDSWRDNVEKQIYAITDYQAGYDTMGDFFREEYFPQRIRHGVRVKNLLPKSSAGEQDEKEAGKFLREMKFINIFKDLNIEINIYGQKIFFVSFDPKNPTGILIKNQKIASAMKNIFEYLWKK